MTLYPQYRMTVYVASLDATASTVLTPAGGAPHSDNFKVNQKQGVAGWQPYLGRVSGRRGRIDPLTKKLSSGQLTVTLIDKRTGTSNLSRWVTAFLGTAAGVTQVLQCKAYVEQSLDNGTTWAAFWVGRIERFDLVGPLEWEIQLDDMSKDLNEPVFVGRPHSDITYALEPLVLPTGLSGAYGDLAPAAVLSGAASSPAGFPSGVRGIVLSAESATRGDNVATKELYRYGAYAGNAFKAGSAFQYQGARRYYQAQPGGLRVRMNCASPSFTDKELDLVGFEVGPGSLESASLVTAGAVTVLYVKPVDASDPFYQAFDSGTVSDTTALTFVVRKVTLATGDGATINKPTPSNRVTWSPNTPIVTTDESPLILTGAGGSGVNPATLAADMLAGKFGKLDVTGAVVRAFPLYSTSFTNITTAAGNRRGLPTSHWYITNQSRLNDFLERYICQPYHLCYRMEPYDNAGNPVSRVVMSDMRLAAVADLGSIGTITDADLAAETAPKWASKSTDAHTVIRVTTYVDDVVTNAELRAGQYSASRLVPTPFTIVSVEDTEIGRKELGLRYLDIDAQGLRVATDWSADGFSGRAYLSAGAKTIRNDYLPMFGYGVAEVEIRCLRTSNTSNLWPGTWVYLDCDMLPDPATNLRGGKRLVMVTERSEEGLEIGFSAIDAGPYTSAGVPTLGTITLGTPAQHVIQVPVTVNGNSDPVVIEVNNTGTGATRYLDPGSGNAGWRFAKTVTASATYDIPNCPSGVTMQVRLRSEPTSRLRLPSAWVIGGLSGAGDGYRDTTAYTRISALSTSTAAATAAETIIASWTNGVSYLPIALGVTDAGASFPDLGWLGTTYGKVILPPGTTSCVLNPWVSAGGATKTYRVNVGHVDGFGGEGSEVTAAVSFTVGTGFTGPTLGTPTLTLAHSYITGFTGYDKYQFRRDRVTGYRFTVTGAVPGTTIILERDTGAGFGSPVEVGRYDGALGPVTIEYLESDANLTRYFRCKLTEPGFADSAYSSIVSGKPAVIR